MAKRLGLAFVALLFILALGTFGLILIENHSLWDAVYITVETVTTVGFGDFEINSFYGKVLLIFLMLGGAGATLYFTGLIMAFFIEGQLADIYGRRKMNKQIDELKNHVIICGAGRVGKQVLNRLRKESVPSVVIEQREDLVKELINEGYIALLGDATEDEILKKVHIERAKGLITAMPDDAINVFVTMSAKGLNPNVQVVARMDRLESEKKLLRAGADKVISPAILGGWRMAMSILKPVSVEYIDTLIHDHNIQMEIEELYINKDSCLVGKTLANSGIKEKTGAIILAILREGKVISNPDASEKVLSSDLLIVIGLKEQLEKLEDVAASRLTLKDSNL